MQACDLETHVGALHVFVIAVRRIVRDGPQGKRGKIVTTNAFYIKSNATPKIGYR
jgi:hypothetical protein